MKGTRFYRIWVGMKTRCYNNKHTYFKHYGGKGIKVCKAWLDFQNFYKDMGPSYFEHAEQFGIANTTLDRLNNSKNYSKKNCRWATRLEQSNNASNNILIKFRGSSKTIKEWAGKLGISYGVLWNRLYDQKMPLEKALTLKKRIYAEN